MRFPFMDFLITTLGSHGDVHPFVGIGRALAARGHRVRLATNTAFGEMIRRAGLEFVPIGSAEFFEDVQNDPDIWHARRGPMLVMRYIQETLREVYDMACTEAAAGTTLVGSSLCLGVRSASEKMGLPMATIHLSPICIRSSQQMPVLPGGFDANWVPRFLRGRFWDGADRWYIDPLIAPAINELHADIGLPPVTGVQKNWWHAPKLTIGLWPDWFFPRQSDYPEQVRLAGFPLYDEADQIALDSDLIGWLDAGDAPIAFTPGSAMRFGRSFFEAAVDACLRLKRRGILLTRHVEHLPPHLPPEIRHTSFAPFGLLLPRCAALVHHGGIGTTAQALSAGIPQIIMPMSHDQFDNAAICRRLGVGRAIGRRQFSGRRLAAVLSDIAVSGDTRAACERISRLSKQHNTLALVVNLLESIST